MNKLAIIAVAALTAGTFGAAAMAQDATGDFDKADANNDNLVSWEEAVGVYPTLTQELFNQADANKDGSLDEGEFTGLQGLTAGDGNSTEPSSSSEAPSSSSEPSAP